MCAALHSEATEAKNAQLATMQAAIDSSACGVPMLILTAWLASRLAAMAALVAKIQKMRGELDEVVLHRLIAHLTLTLGSQQPR